jgi:phosphatidylglycerophosphate synthase
VKLSQILSFPNQLTLMRMMFLPFIVIKLVEGHYSSALILFVLAGISDGLDGLLARALKQQTTLGQYLDMPSPDCATSVPAFLAKPTPSPRWPPYSSCCCCRFTQRAGSRLHG